MAWIYLAELEVSHSHSSLGSEPSPIVKVTDTLRPFYCHECWTSNLIEPQSGMTCGVCGAAISLPSTSSQVDFHARTSVLRGLVRAWKVSEADYFLRSPDSLASFDPVSFSWRTSQPLEQEVQTLSEKKWPAWGTIVDGRLYQPQKLEPSTFVNDGGYLPTPTASDYGRNVSRKSDGITPRGRVRWSLKVLAQRGELSNHPQGRLNPEWLEQAMGYPSTWTEVGAWVTQWFLSKRKQRSED